MFESTKTTTMQVVPRKYFMNIFYLFWSERFRINKKYWRNVSYSLVIVHEKIKKVWTFPQQLPIFKCLMKSCVNGIAGNILFRFAWNPIVDASEFQWTIKGGVFVSHYFPYISYESELRYENWIFKYCSILYNSCRSMIHRYSFYVSNR